MRGLDEVADDPGREFAQQRHQPDGQVGKLEHAQDRLEATGHGADMKKPAQAERQAGTKKPA